MSHTLVLLRHGQTIWNKQNLFTGWVDADLTKKGCEEAAAAGPAMIDAGVFPTVLHTSLQTRAIRTANLALDAMDRLWVPVHRSWRLNERHYGDLTGMDKKQATEQFGAEQVKIWRRSYDVPPPTHHEDQRAQPGARPPLRHPGPRADPRSECLKDVVERMLPYWFDAIVPDLDAGHVVLVAAHGNSLRALVKHLDGISDDDIAELNLPTGVPLVYELNNRFRPSKAMPVFDRFLGDAEAAKRAAAAVAAQAG